MPIYSEYWNPKTRDRAPRGAAAAATDQAASGLCEYAYANVPFHKRRWDAAGFHPDQLKTLDDLRRIPFMTREEWMESLQEKPLFGDMLSTDPHNAIRYHLTSGTTGRTPIRVLDSTKDWEWIAEMWCYGLWGFGIRPEDIVYFAFGYGSFIGFWGAHYACEKMGALVIPGGAQTTEAPHQADRRAGRHHRRLHPHLRPQHVAEGPRDGHRPGQGQQGQQDDRLGRAGGLHPRRQAPARSRPGAPSAATRRA